MAREVNRGEIWQYRFKSPDKRRPVLVLSRQEVIPLLHTVMALMRGRSVLLITHRLSALTELVDEVLVMDAGGIVERGAPGRLARGQGPFSGLWRCDSRECLDAPAGRG